MKFPAAIFILLLGISLRVSGQYPPGAGSEGTTAIHADSVLITSWATKVNVVRGYLNIASKDLGYASAGEAGYALGKADNFVVSLGDSGMAVIGFDWAIKNNPGHDFAVFENSFDGSFLELAFVEVSSDSSRWVRFPSTSGTDATLQVGTYGTIDPEKINNLAGKYEVFYGTPFDLEEVSDSTGIDLDNIKYIRIIDVIGSITEGTVTYDSHGTPVNDPWPTPFISSGFDLDGVALLGGVSAHYETVSLIAAIYPVPAVNSIRIISLVNESSTFIVSDMTGRRFLSGKIQDQVYELDISILPPGTYFFEMITGGKREVRRFIKR